MMLTPFMVVGDMFSFDDDTLEPSNPQPQLTQQASGKAPYPYLTVGISYMYLLPTLPTLHRYTWRAARVA